MQTRQLVWEKLLASRMCVLYHLEMGSRRPSRTIHTKLVGCYLKHGGDFEVLLRTGDYGGLEEAVRAFDETEALEAREEGKPNNEVLERVYDEVLRRLGARPNLA